MWSKSDTPRSIDHTKHLTQKGTRPFTDYNHFSIRLSKHSLSLCIKPSSKPYFLSHLTISHNYSTQIKPLFKGLCLLSRGLVLESRVRSLQRSSSNELLDLFFYREHYNHQERYNYLAFLITHGKLRGHMDVAGDETTTVICQKRPAGKLILIEFCWSIRF